jgi:hypothetical protein
MQQKTTAPIFQLDATPQNPVVETSQVVDPSHAVDAVFSSYILLNYH